MTQDPKFFKEILMKNDHELLTALLKNDGTFSFRLKDSMPFMKFIMNQYQNIKNANMFRSYLFQHNSIILLYNNNILKLKSLYIYNENPAFETILQRKFRK